MNGIKRTDLPWGVRIDFSWPELAGTYEKEAWKYITCPEGGVAIDAGAHQGFYTTKLSKEAGPQGHVFAFEPDLNNCFTLIRNINLNNLTNVTLLRTALADHDGVGRLFTYVGPKPLDTSQHFLRGIAGQSFWDKLHKSPPAPHLEVKVKVQKLDTALAPYILKRLDLIKMDVEGAEPLVLKGAQETIKRYSPKIVFEVHFGKKNLPILRKLGYRITTYVEKLNFGGNPFVVYSK